jgi:hypothetical protein
LQLADSSARFVRRFYCAELPVKNLRRIALFLLFPYLFIPSMNGSRGGCAGRNQLYYFEREPEFGWALGKDRRTSHSSRRMIHGNTKNG